MQKNSSEDEKMNNFVRKLLGITLIPPSFFKRLDEESEDTGIIYCITNIITGKRYIGQTLSYRRNHDKTTRFGMNGRFKEHINEATKGKNCCPKLYFSMRKHGENPFICNQLVICNKSDLNDFETYYIKYYESHTDKGYNVITRSFGGYKNGSRTEKIRKIISEKWKDKEYIEKRKKGHLASRKKLAKSGALRTKHKGLPHNIYKSSNGGYLITVKRNNVRKNAFVKDITKSDEELLKSAVIKRDLLIHQMETTNSIEQKTKEKQKDHNGKKLPTGISKHRYRGLKRNTNGYQVSLMINGKKKSKSFTDQTKTMDEKLQQAINWLNENKPNIAICK